MQHSMMKLKSATSREAWVGPLLALLTGALGGALQGKLLEASLPQNILLGALFGLAFGALFAKRATSPGAGLVWALASAFLLWFIAPDGIHLWLTGASRSADMLNDAQQQFPRRVRYLVCLGMPAGISVGIP